MSHSTLRARLAQLVLLLLALVAAGAPADAQTVTIPQTNAGQLLEAWLDAFNSGDRARIQAYIDRFQSRATVDGLIGMRGQSGGFDLIAIESSEPLVLKFRLKARSAPTTAYGRFSVKPGEPILVDDGTILALPPGVVIEDIELDAAGRKRVIDGAIAKLNESYVFPETAQKMADALRARQASGEYDAITDGNPLARLLTEHLRAVSNDRHLNVMYLPFKRPAQPEGPPTAEQQQRMREQMMRINCGFEKIEILPGNIGYLKFNMFANPDVCGPTATAAMNFLAHVSAIIFDLRSNGGGDPKMVALISSYLFDEPTHLNDIYERKENSTKQYWTLPFVPGERLGSKPAFVLTSRNTFSGAEEFAYNLKNLKRATIVGETTGGGAHPVRGEAIDDHFMIGVPFARAINPISKTNWEGTGVAPDVEASAADALDVAQKLASSKSQGN